MYQKHFNSQPHKEADPVKDDRKVVRYISTHSLTRRLTRMRLLGVWEDEYFNSQPHKEADDGRTVSAHVERNISTHSLTRRLTLNISIKFEDYKISTHSLTRRLTLVRVAIL